jgi:hypothetical protein
LKTPPTTLQIFTPPVPVEGANYTISRSYSVE